MKKSVHVTHEFRLVWQHKGRSQPQSIIAQRPARILRMLRRLGTDEPWMGITASQVRRCWVRLSLMLDVPWDNVANMRVRDVMRYTQQAYPELDFIRVEWRQVGAWTEMLDPLVNLRTASTTQSEHKLETLLNRLDTMSPEDLDNWRLTPPDVRGDMRPSTHRKKYSFGTTDKRRANLRRQSRGEQGAAALIAETERTSGTDDPAGS